uniref:Uncharacterized protein n=1 Tax=Anguilla anguilla TaxID=7936 RepID=A0A0E9VPR4_ANGAN
MQHIQKKMHFESGFANLHSPQGPKFNSEQIRQAICPCTYLFLNTCT